jgi:hypothetical protein
MLAVVAFAGAGLLAFAGLRAVGGDDSVLYADDVVASVLPPTVPPVVTTRPPVTEPPAPESTEPALSASTIPPVTTTTVPPPRAEPVGLQISTIDVSGFPVRSVGLQENGQLEIPDETEIGWYKYGATAGRPGSTVLAAHVNWNGSQGPFAQLGAVEPGDEIAVALEDGTTRDYIVTERTMYGKLELPKDRIWRNTGPEELVLITCGGEFNPEIRRFKSNIVVYAVPVAGTPPARGLDRSAL